MRRTDFRFELPGDLIAQRPLAKRTESRLLHIPPTGSFQDRQFSDLLELLAPDDLLVLNDTRVVPARAFGYKLTGGRVEVLLERLLDETTALMHCRSSKALQAGARIMLTGRAEGIEVIVLRRERDLCEVEFPVPALGWLEANGSTPLPPYIQRPEEAEDRWRYQTVYAAKPGAVAAPTAGLHFDRELLGAASSKGVELGYLTLHVGAGTFQPVRVDSLIDHTMHAEYVCVSKQLSDQVSRARGRGGRVIAVGTTSVRGLEFASISGGIRPVSGLTELFITPGYRFQTVDAMITNFHLPESTLLMLVSAFSGREKILAAYAHAVNQRYRFFSYGDAMFIERPEVAA